MFLCVKKYEISLSSWSWFNVYIENNISYIIYYYLILLILFLNYVSILNESFNMLG